MTFGVRSGMTTITRTPARAPYAAHAEPALPALGSASVSTPSSAARVMPTAAPRALNVPVGSRPSSFTRSLGMRSSSPSDGVSRSGAFDPGAERAEPRVELFVPTIDLLHVVYDACALGAECRREERHPCANIGTPHLRSAELRRPHHDGAMGVGEHDTSTHLARERVDEVQTALEHPLVDKNNAFGLRREHRRHTRKVRRESGPDLRLELRDRATEIHLDLEAVPRRDEHVITSYLGLDAKTAKDETHHAQVFGNDAVDRRLTVRHRDRSNQRANLHVIAEQRVISPVKTLDPIDNECVRPDAADLPAHGNQCLRELLYVRLARRVVESCPPLRYGRCEQGVLGRGHRRLVEDHIRAAEASRRHREAAGAHVECCPELAER